MGNKISWFNDYKIEHGPIIETKYGKVQGKTFCFHDGKDMHAFLGVPFARNGTHHDRFKVLIVLLL